MIDYHLHLWPHAEVASQDALTPESLGRYAEAARALGIREVAVTEHLFRFRQAAEALGEFWADEPDEALRNSMRDYVAHHATADLDAYVDGILAARRTGERVRLGLEVDYYPRRMEVVTELLASYPFDVLLGSVHWLGAWRFDDLDDEASIARWGAGRRADIWRAYTDAVVDLAASRTCDVLAHVDLAKVTGVVPAEAVVEECHERIATAVVESGLAVEVSSAGLRKPVGEIYPAPALLRRLALRGVPFTTASDAHEPENVGHRFAELEDELVKVGVGSLRAFELRRPLEVPIRRARAIGGSG